MKVFYYCSTGNGPSTIAAAIHLGVLPPGKCPAELEKLSALKIHTPRLVGELIFMGTDENGNEIYTFGIGREKSLLKKVVTDLLKIYNKQNECILVDTSYADNNFVKWGQRLKGELGLFLCSLGFRREYAKLACTVHHTLAQLKHTGAT